MEIRFSCPVCGQHIKADEDMAGASVKCPICGKQLIVPPAGQAAPQPPAQPPPVTQPVPAPPTPAPSAGAAPRAEVTVSYPPAGARELSRVVVTDIRMRFGSMVRFMIMWALASIPAFLMLAVIWGAIALLFTLLFTGLGAVLFSGGGGSGNGF
jgi:DNA-directed RNA polymerase subunit RPC12/RpoP